MLIFVVAVCGILTMLAVRCPHSQLLFEYNYKWQLHGACIPLRRAIVIFIVLHLNHYVNLGVQFLCDVHC